MESPIFTTAATPRLTIREATPADGPALQALQAHIEHAGEVRTRKINTPDFFARVRAFDQYKVLVATEGDRVVASDAVTIRPAMVAGRLLKVAHGSHTFVHPELQGAGIGSLFKRGHLEPHLRAEGVSLIYGHVADGNERSLRSVSRAGWEVARPVTFTGLPVYRSMPTRREYTVRPFRAEDAAAVAELANRTWGRHELYTPLRVEDLASSLQRTYGDHPDAVSVLEASGRIVACAGVWDWSAAEQITVLGLSPKLRLLAPALDLARRVRPAPRIPAVGDVLRQWLAAPIGFEDPADFGEILRALNNRAQGSGVEQIFLMSERGAPVLRATEGFFTVKMHLRLVVRRLDPEVRLGDGPLYVAPTDA